MILSYVKGINQQEHVKQLVEGNKEQDVVATTIENSRKEEPMEAFHKVLCGHVIAGNGVNCVEDVAMQKTLKGVANRGRDGLLG